MQRDLLLAGILAGALLLRFDFSIALAAFLAVLWGAYSARRLLGKRK